MSLVWLILIPMVGGLVAGLVARKNESLCRWISLSALILDSGIAINLFAHHWLGLDLPTSTRWLVEFQVEWIPRLGAGIHLAVDGLSLLMVLLTLFLGIIGVGASWTEIKTQVGFFHFNFLWILSGVIGVFLALDLLLFFFFWEVMLVPMYFLIGIWGHENRQYAAVKFFIFTQASGLVMLLSILVLVFTHAASGELTFDYMKLLGTPMDGTFGLLVMLGFFLAFTVKLPAFPFHPWLPDAHTEAPTAGSIILAGILLKTGAYGLLRFVVPLFPAACQVFTPYALFLGVVGVLYGAMQAFAQSDLKRLVAYTSVSHMGFVLLGVFAWNDYALYGVVMQMICHGFSSGAQFMLVGALYERVHTREMGRMGGLWTTAPRLGAASMFFAMASLGLPGMGNFIAEFLVLTGLFKVSVTATSFASLGLIAATIYSLWLMRGTFFGPNDKQWKIADLNARELSLVAALVAGLVFLGFYPQPVLKAVHPALEALQQSTAQAPVPVAMNRR
ncbi:MAG: NADH-quinone oxidoreductase subunit M [Candidatus Omnitrophica bacterium]|nr:NADH-quinone oxidoreductase subunit M [Candidatus Omnitrophota bacterium]